MTYFNQSVNPSIPVAAGYDLQGIHFIEVGVIVTININVVVVLQQRTGKEDFFHTISWSSDGALKLPVETAMLQAQYISIANVYSLITVFDLILLKGAIISYLTVKDLDEARRTCDACRSSRPCRCFVWSLDFRSVPIGRSLHKGAF